MQTGAGSAADQARDVLEFWFGKPPWTASDLAERARLWFGNGGAAKGEANPLDATLRDRFGALMEQAASGALDGWAASPRRRLALILLLDQFPRNVYRGSARAFASDARALELSREGIELGADAALDPVERMFFYMPLQHAESRDAQELAVSVYRRLVEDAAPPLRPAMQGSLDFAIQHRDIVERFGRFPHRNRALGRATTPDEARYLSSGAERFGQ